MVEGICDARLEEAEALDGDRQVVVVRGQVFTRFRVAISFQPQNATAACAEA